MAHIDKGVIPFPFISAEFRERGITPSIMYVRSEGNKRRGMNKVEVSLPQVLFAQWIYIIWVYSLLSSMVQHSMRVRAYNAINENNNYS